MTTKSRLSRIARHTAVRAFRAYLAEEYDGILQYVNLTMSKGSTTGALRAKIASGDHGLAMRYPVGTPVVVISNHGLLEVLSLGLRDEVGGGAGFPSVPSVIVTTPVWVDLIIDDWNNRTLPDTTPSIGSGDATGSWGTASCGTDWDLFPSNSNAHFGVGSSVGGGLLVGRYLREQRGSSLAPGGWGAILYPIPTPENDEPIFSFMLRMPAAIPSDAAGFTGKKGPMKFRFTIASDWASDSINLLVGISSVVGKGGLAIGTNTAETLTGFATYSKTDWVGGAMYQFDAQFLHDGTIQVRTWRPDTESAPAWQITYDSGGDYDTWGPEGGSFEIVCVNYNDADLDNNGHLESQRVEFEDFVWGQVQQ